MDIAQLPSLMLSGNFPEEVTFQGNAQTVVISMNGETLLEEYYEHDGSYIIHLRLREFFHSLLETVLPTSDLFIQESSAADFSIQVEDQSGPVTYSFRLVKGGVDSASLVDSTTFLWANFLTWQPPVKKVKLLDPQWLTYYSVQESRLMVQATYQEAGELVTAVPVLFYTLPEYKKCTLNVQFQHLWNEFMDGDRAPYYIDCWIEDEGQDKKTYTQRYVLTGDFHEFDDLFCFENSLGGIDVIRFTGEQEYTPKHEIKSALFTAETREYDILVNREFTKNTGYFRNDYEAVWAGDFLLSMNRYIFLSGAAFRVVVNSFESKEIKTEFNYFSFTYSYSKQSRFLNPAAAGQSAALSDGPLLPQAINEIYVRVFGDQNVDGVKTFQQPVKTNEVRPASGENLVLNNLTVKEGGIIDCGEF